MNGDLLRGMARAARTRPRQEYETAPVDDMRAGIEWLVDNVPVEYMDLLVNEIAEEVYKTNSPRVAVQNFLLRIAGEL